MSLVAHRIRRLTWLVQTTSASSALAQRQSLRTELESVLLPSLERVFDQYATGDQVLRIPKLTLHVTADYGTMTDLARLVEEQLVRLIDEQIPRRMDRQLATVSDGPMALGVRDALPVRQHALAFDRDSRQGISHDAHSVSQPKAQQTSAQDHRRGVLIEYLRSGRIGWHTTAQETPALVEWLRDEAERLVVEQPNNSSILEGSLETRFAMSFRLWQLLTPAVRDQWLRNVSLPPEAIIAALVQSAINPQVNDYWRLRITAVLFALRDADLNVIREHRLDKVFAEWSLPLAACGITDAFQEKRDRHFASQQFKIEQPAKEADESETVSRHGSTTALTPDSRSKEERSKDIVSRLRGGADDDIAWRVQAIDPPPALDVPGLMTLDAGLILLHPFLPRLFEATGISVANCRALPSESLPAAAALLNWLATGRENVFEFELSLSKVLLGLTPDDPLPVADGLLSQRDRDEGDAMLAAVIEHWSALRQTSVAGLRTSFLQRRGILRDDELRWRLRMETFSFDLLLGQLPWSITAVKLPWMKKPIITDWPTP